jgi:outer membrane lipoprotein-sorting protein/peroxiredoxin
MPKEESAESFTVRRRPARPAPQQSPRPDGQPKMDAETAAVIRRWGQAYQQMKTLIYVSEFLYIIPQESALVRRVTIRYWLRRPNLLRVEVESSDEKENSLMVSDGRTLWQYCPATEQYMKAPVPADTFQIRGELAGLRYVPPMLFFAASPEQALLKDVRSVASKEDEKSGGEKFTYVERTGDDRKNFAWLSPSDNLPRLSVTYRVRNAHTEVVKETRKQLRADGTLPKSLFTFRPPKTAQLFRPSSPSQTLLPAGTMAPDFKVTDRDEEKVRLSSLRGRPVLLTFWATWSNVNKGLLPALQKLHDEFAQTGLTVVALNTWDQPDAMDDFLEKHPDLHLTFWIDPEENKEKTVAAQLYGVTGIPTTYLIDADGKIVNAWFGYDEKILADLREALSHFPARKKNRTDHPDTDDTDE